MLAESLEQQCQSHCAQGSVTDDTEGLDRTAMWTWPTVVAVLLC